MVGVANTAFYSLLLWQFMSIEYLPYPVAIGFAFGIAMIFQYLANKYFTFGSIARSFSEVARYITGAGINYLISVLIVWVCLDIIHTSKLIASVFSAFLAATVGYLISFSWVYKNEH